MKKVICLLLCIVSVLAVFAGCGESEKVDATTITQGSTSTTVPATTTQPTTTTTTKPTTVQTTTSNDELAKWMLENYTCDYNTLPEKMTFISSGDKPVYRIIDSYSKMTQLLTNFNNWTLGLESKYTDIFWDVVTEYFEDAIKLYDKNFFESNSVLMIYSPSVSLPLTQPDIDDISVSGDKVNVVILGYDIYYDDGESIISFGNIYSSLFFIPIPKNDLARISDININVKVESFEEIPAEKPIIYLYPETETEVDVKLGYKENIIVSYPEYVDGWNVIAQPDGKLVYTATGRKLYSLYYECNNSIYFGVRDDGFVVKGDDTIAFLEEKLAILGLNEYEAEEFIVYWLPILQQNEYNYIRFATQEEIDRNMPLEIDPNPDTVIRVLMTFKGLDEPIDVVEQQLITPERTGFVAVEWGGTRIK